MLGGDRAANEKAGTIGKLICRLGSEVTARTATRAELLVLGMTDKIIRQTVGNEGTLGDADYV